MKRVLILCLILVSVMFGCTDEQITGDFKMPLVNLAERNVAPNNAVCLYESQCGEADGNIIVFHHDLPILLGGTMVEYYDDPRGLNDMFRTSDIDLDFEEEEGLIRFVEAESYNLKMCRPQLMTFQTDNGREMTFNARLIGFGDDRKTAIVEFS